MKYDITPLLSDWEYDPSNISARWVDGEDGQRKVQLRLDLGLFQMELDGRPDGNQPRGYESLMAYYRTQEATTRNRAELKLDEAACSELQQEAVQYYYRYLCLYALEDLERVVRDTEHNLAIFSYVSKHAEDEDLTWQFLQFFPEVKTMQTRAQAEWAAHEQQYERAAQVIKQGLSDVRAFWKQHGELETDESSQEEDVLTELLMEIRERRPLSRSDRLRDALERAVRSENYEKAALLRDEINRAEDDVCEPEVAAKTQAAGPR